MANLGFDAVGRLALGQLPAVSFAVTTGPLVFSTFSQPFPVAPSLKVYLHPPVNFEVENPKAFNPPTPGPLVFTRFSEPLLIKKVDVNQHTKPEFRILRPDGATPGPLVFATFPAQTLQKKVEVNSQTDVKFTVLRPNAATPGPISFNPFSEPSFAKVRPQSDPSWNLFQAPAATSVILGGDFADFDLVQSKKGLQQDFAGFVFVPPAVTPVFTQFSQPQANRLVKEGGIATADVVTVVTVVQPYVFSEYSQPRFRSQAYLQPDVQNEPLRPGAATPASLGIFSPFDPPQGKTVKEGYVANTTVILQQYPVFSRFEQPQTVRVLKEGNVSPALTQVVQNIVFGRFEQPFSKRVLQQDSSFVNLPVVTVVTQPYVFTSFSQPTAAKNLGEGVVAYSGQVIVTAAVTQPYVFSPFEQPQAGRNLKEGLVANSFLLFQPYIFSKFEQPLLKRSNYQDFLNTPVFIPVQNYVFGQFSQPQVGRNYREGFTNATFTASVQSYIFSGFSQPTSKQTLQADQSFVNLPVVIVAQQPYLFSPFEQPRFRTAPQLDAAVQFEIIPPPQVISVVTFTGFSDFATRLYTPIRVDFGGVDYDIFVPITPTAELLAGWRKNRYLWPNHTVKLDSSNVDEMELDPNTGELTVKFKGGREYIYNDVELKRAKGLEKAKSPGKYVNTKLRGKYPTIRIR